MKAIGANAGPSHLPSNFAYMHVIHEAAVVQDIGFAVFSCKYIANAYEIHEFM